MVAYFFIQKAGQKAGKYDTVHYMSPSKNLQKILLQAIEAAQKKKALSETKIGKISVEYSPEEKFGDYTSNVALQYAGVFHLSPRALAEIISKEINKARDDKFLARVEIAGPGFLNFFLADAFFAKQAREIARDEDYGVSSLGKKAPIDIEFLSANPTGEIQVGNARLAFYGDALGNILRFSGFSVTKEYYINNAKVSNQIQELGRTALGLGEKYDTPYLREKLQELHGDLEQFHKQNPSAEDCASAGMLVAEAIQKDIKQFLRKKTGIRFDVWFSEQKLYTGGAVKKMLEYVRREELAYEKDGALWLKTTQFGDDQDKVLVRSSGTATYYLSDIAYHKNKIDRGFKQIIDVLGADHQGHVQPLEVAMKILHYKGVFKTLVCQLVQAKGGGKFSKREGNTISLRELIELVGIDAVRYFYLTRSLDTQIEFDIDLAQSQTNRNPVFYIQYTHARMASILRKAQVKNDELRIRNYALEEGERTLVRKLACFPELIERIASDCEVHRLTTYTLELAQEFNQFYRDYKVLTDDEAQRNKRLMLTVACQNVLQQCFALMGISAPEKM